MQMGQGHPRSGGDPARLDELRHLGLVQAEAERLSNAGWLVADSAREYLWWIERGRRLHADGKHPALSLAFYASKDVLEVGAGFGCTLMSMSGTTRRCVGVEPVHVYRQMAPLLAELENLPAPELHAGWAEQLPFSDAQFDVVACFSAHQYMDIRLAVREMARVLRPGGQLQIVGSVLSWPRFYAHCLRGRAFASVKSELLSAANTLAYERLGRRLYVPKSGGATSAPIHPRPSSMKRWFESAGLRWRDDWSRPLGTAYCFIAERAT